MLPDGPDRAGVGRSFGTRSIRARLAAGPDAPFAPDTEVVIKADWSSGHQRATRPATCWWT